jgi:uncharacterized protein
LNTALSNLVGAVERFALWVVIFYMTIMVVLLYYTAGNLGINTDTEDMLDESLHFRRVSREYNEAFPQHDGHILIVIDGEIAEYVHEATRTLADRLREETALFETVYVPGGGKFFEEHGLLYLGTDELEDLADDLATFQPFFAQLSRDPSLVGLFSMLDRAVEADMGGEGIDLSVLFTRLERAFEATLRGEPYGLSWSELMQGEDQTPEDRRRRFILVQPKLDFERLLPAETAVQAIRRSAHDLTPNYAPGVRVRLTGDIAMEHEEFFSVIRGVGFAGLLALIFVGIVLYAGLGSPRLVAATLLTLVTGLVCTGGFATAAIGTLNLISVAFAVLYIGLSVDYAIHFCLRYKELIERNHSHSTALRQTAQDVGSSLVLCAFTTAAGFYAFIPTAFVGVAELGVISGTSMFIALIANLTLLPAVLTLMPLRRSAISGSRQSSRRLWNTFAALPVRQFVAIRVVAVAVGALAIILLPRVVFDPNPLHLRDPASESMATFRELLADQQASPWYLTVLASDEKEAEDYAKRLDPLTPVASTMTINDFVPEEQDEKLAVIDEIALILGPDLMYDKRLPPPPVSDRLDAIQRFSSTLEGYIQTNPDSALAAASLDLLETIQRFETFLSARDEEIREEMLLSLEQRLLSSLPVNLRMLNASLSAGRVTKESLPEALVEQWVSDDGRYRVQVMPRENLNDDEALRRFVSAVQRVAPDATGFPVIILGAGEAVVEAFQQAFLLALVFIAVLLFLLMRSIADTLRILASLVLAGILTGGALVLLGIPVNFANVIALPLIMGMGVDSGIHIVQRIRTAPPPGGRILQTSTARAILFSTLTTLCGFGNLAFSAHRGMASMGQLLSIGIIFTLVCSLVVLPALIKPAVYSRIRNEPP